MALLDRLLRRLVRQGTLECVTPGGQVLTVGDGAGPALRLRIADRAALIRLVADPALAAGELLWKAASFPNAARSPISWS